MCPYLSTERSNLTASAFAELEIRIAIFPHANEAVETSLIKEWRVQSGQKRIGDAGDEVPSRNALGCEEAISAVRHGG